MNVKHPYCRILLVAACLCLSLLPAEAARRVALVIGNSDYQHVARLPNPANDTEDLAGALEKVGFTVRRETNLTFEGMRRALRDFSDEAIGSDMALIYYAGHGMEVDKQNYLIPVDARLNKDRDLPYEAIPLELVSASVDGAKELKLVLLDACRNNPFNSIMEVTSATRAIGRGLARVEPEAGTLIGFASREGTTADDGDGRNSPYAKALIDFIGEPGLEVNFLFRKVHDAVVGATQGRQQPFMHGALPGRLIYFVPPVEQPKAEPQIPTVSNVPSPEIQVELAYWDSIKGAGDPKLFKAYLDQYPNGRFATLARLMLKQAETKLASRDTSAEVQEPAKQPLATQPPPESKAEERPEPQKEPAVKKEPIVKKEPPAKQKVAVAPRAKEQAENFRPNAVCRSWLNKFRNGHQPHAAFAVAANGSCGWSAGGLSSVKAAVSQALSECRKQHPRCRVVATK
ncbi:MAG: caspase family protein [Parvibaculaceae bacterium]